MKTGKWIPAARFAVLFFLAVLFFNAYMLFAEIRRTVIYNSRCYGLEVLNEYFDSGDYYRVYEKTTENRYADQTPAVDVSQYEAFGRYYHSWMMAKTHADRERFLSDMEEAKQKITRKKIRNVIEQLERELPD